MSAATPVRKIADWIDEMRARADTPGRLARLVCLHVIKGNKLGDELRMVTVPPEIDEEWIAATAHKIADQAGEEARTLGNGIQRYAVQAFFDGGGDRPSGRHVFTCAGQEELGSIGTEGPDAEGLTSQAMRHAEFYAKLNAGAALQQMEALQAEIAALRRENAGLRDDRIRSFKVMEEVYSLRAEREIATERERAKAKLFSDGAEKLGLLLPMALNHMAGKQIFPESATQALMLKSLVESIDKPTFEKLASVLNGEQMALFFQLATSVAKPANPPPPAEGSALAPSNGVTS